MKSEAVPSKWLPVSRHIADAVPAAILLAILDHERRIMPQAMRAHLADLEREAAAWRARQEATRDGRYEARVPAIDVTKAEGSISPPLRNLASSDLPARPMPWKNPRIKRRLTPGKAT
jgi:hypothetical protein